MLRLVMAGDDFGPTVHDGVLHLRHGGDDVGDRRGVALLDHRIERQVQMMQGVLISMHQFGSMSAFIEPTTMQGLQYRSREFYRSGVSHRYSCSDSWGRYGPASSQRRVPGRFGFMKTDVIRGDNLHQCEYGEGIGAGRTSFRAGGHPPCVMVTP